MSTSMIPTGNILSRNNVSMNSGQINNEKTPLIAKIKQFVSPRKRNKKLEENMTFWKTQSLTIQQEITWEIYKTKQTTKTKWLNHLYPDFEIFDMQPLIVVHLLLLLLLFFSAEHQLFLYTFFIKKDSEVINQM